MKTVYNTENTEDFVVKHTAIPTDQTLTDQNQFYKPGKSLIVLRFLSLADSNYEFRIINFLTYDRFALRLMT